MGRGTWDFLITKLKHPASTRRDIDEENVVAFDSWETVRSEIQRAFPAVDFTSADGHLKSFDSRFNFEPSRDSGESADSPIKALWMRHWLADLQASPHLAAIRQLCRVNGWTGLDMTMGEVYTSDGRVIRHDGQIRDTSASEPED